MQTADQLKLAGDEMILKIKPLTNETLTASSEESPNKKKGRKPSRFFTLNSKKKKSDPSAPGISNMVLQKSDPSIRNQRPHIPHERISDTYINALTFYTACCKTSSPTTAMYIRMQMTNILEQLTQLYMPVDLFNRSTLFEPGYKEVIMQSKSFIQEPIMHSLVINDVIKKHAVANKILKSHQNKNCATFLSKKLQACMKTLMYIYASNRTNAYQQIITRAYTDLTWHLLHKIPECATKNAAIQSLYDEWSSIHAQPLNLQPLFDELDKHAKSNNMLYKNPLVFKNAAFCEQLIKDQCNILHHLLSLHRTQKNNVWKQFWIGKAANAIIKSISEIVVTQKPNLHFLRIYGKWQEKHLDVASILHHIQKQQSHAHRNLKLQREQTVSTYFEMLPVLIDLYTEHAIPPALLNRIINPIETIFSTLFTVFDINPLHLPPEQQWTINRARLILETAPQSYALKHILLKAERYFRTKKAMAKAAYFEASEHILNTHNAQAPCDPMTLDHIYTHLLILHERKTSFSTDELIKLERLATYIKRPLPTRIAIKREVQILSSFIQKGVVQDRIKSYAPACSSSRAK